VAYFGNEFDFSVTEIITQVDTADDEERFWRKIGVGGLITFCLMILYDPNDLIACPHHFRQTYLITLNCFRLKIH
jgi:hypothetical protein